MQRNMARWLLAILIGLLAASVSFAFAANKVTFGADSALIFEEEDDDGEDEIIEKMGMRIELSGGVRVVVTNKADSRIGDVFVPAYSVDALAKNALDDYDLAACVCSIGIIEAYQGGVLFVLKEKHNQKAMSTLMAHLRDIGAEIGALEASGRAFGFVSDGVAYRAVFSADAEGTLVYLGN